MKKFTIKKLFKPLLSGLLVALMIVPINVFAATSLVEQAINEPATKELISIFPNFQKSLYEHTNGKLVSANEVYYKYTPKATANIKKVYTNESDIKKDFEIQEYTKQQYEKQILNPILKSSIGGQEEVPCSWLSVNLQVYNSKYSNEYLAYGFYSWKTQPFFQFTDAIGISLTSGLIVTDDTNKDSTRHAEYNYETLKQEDTNITLPVEIQDGAANGVMARVPLGNGAWSSYNNMMISTGVRYSGSGTNAGWISANYLHKEIGIGAINMDAAGVPSVSAGTASSSHHALVPVSK